MRRVRADETAQASVEHVGVLSLIAVALAAAALSAPKPRIASVLADALCGTYARQCARAAGPDAEAAEPGPGAEPGRPRKRDLVAHWIDADLDAFLAYRLSTERDPRLDYSTDRCSAPLVGSVGRSFDFTAACTRHDFGYRNYDRLGLFERRKRLVDDRFLVDMLAHCDSREPTTRDRCRAWATTFHLAVRHFGQLSGHGRRSVGG